MAAEQIEILRFGMLKLKGAVSRHLLVLSGKFKKFNNSPQNELENISRLHRADNTLVENVTLVKSKNKNEKI